MGAFIGSQKFFKHPLVEVAKKYGYDEDNLFVLKGDLRSLENFYPETYRNIISCDYHSDNRKCLEYARDLVASWLIEDSFLEVLNTNGLQATLGGADRNRKILANFKTTEESDFIVSYNGCSRGLELMNDYTGYWARTGNLHLRDNKYPRLTTEHSLFLAVSIKRKEFALYDFNENIPATFIPSHPPFGGKPAYQLSITRNMMKEATPLKITEAIKEHL